MAFLYPLLLIDYEVIFFKNNISIFKISPKDTLSLELLFKFKLQFLLIYPLTYKRIYQYLHLLQVIQSIR